ncbi:MAG: hypothetical protein ACYTG5_20050 [Planctomycetota bacterium]|jgi:hypothetical protein
MTNPRFGFDNLLDRFSSGVITFNEQADHPGVNAYDWRPQSFWRQQQSTSIFSNGKFDLWANGPASAPDGMQVTGAGATVARFTETDAGRLPYSAQLTRVGADCTLEVTLSNADESYTGVRLYLAAEVEASSADVSIFITDSAGTVSAAHSGGGSYENLLTSRLIQPGGTITFGLRIQNSDQSAKIDNLYFGEFRVGTLPPAFEPQDCVIEVHPAEGQLLRNWLLQEWSDGGDSFPDLFSSTEGTLTSVRRNDNVSKLGDYAMRVVGTDHITAQEVTGDELELMKGRTCWFSVFADTTEVSGVRVGVQLRLQDGSLTGEIAGTPGAGGREHTGSGSYEWLSTSLEIPESVTGVLIALVQSDGASQNVLWDAPMVVVSETEPLEPPHIQPVNYLAVTAHNAATADKQFILQGSDDNFQTVNAIFSAAPTADKTFWIDIDEPTPAASYKSYRLIIRSNSAQSRTSEIGMISFGEYFQFPCAPLAPFRILNERFESELPKTKFGVPLGRSIPRVFKSFELRFQLFYRPFVVDEVFEKWWKHAGRYSGKPFFLQWNDGDYPDETYFVWLPDNSQFNPQLFVAQQIRDFTIQLEGLPD